MRESHDKFERWHKQQRFDKDGESRDEYVDLFKNEMRKGVYEELAGFRARCRDGVGEVEWSIVCPAFVDCMGSHR